MIKRKWPWGLLIGAGIGILLNLLLVLLVTTRTFCIEPPSCGDKLNSFLLGLRFFIPAGAAVGLFFGLLFDRKFYPALAVLAVVGAGLYFIFMKPPTISEISQQVQNSTPSTKDETVSWETYSNSKYNVSFKYPSALTIKEIDPVKSGETSVETGNLLWINVGNNFTVEISSKKPASPYDYVSENYSQKQQVIFGTDKKSLTAYLTLNATQGECYGVSTVRGSCKDYFAVPVQGQKYWYIFTGVLANKAITKDDLNLLSSAIIE